MATCATTRTALQLPGRARRRPGRRRRGQIVGGFSDVSGLGIEVKLLRVPQRQRARRTTSRKIPNTHKHDDVTLKRGLIGDLRPVRLAQGRRATATADPRDGHDHAARRGARSRSPPGAAQRAAEEVGRADAGGQGRRRGGDGGAAPRPRGDRVQLSSLLGPRRADRRPRCLPRPAGARDASCGRADGRVRVRRRRAARARARAVHRRGAHRGAARRAVSSGALAGRPSCRDARGVGPSRCRSRAGTSTCACSAASRARAGCRTRSRRSSSRAAAARTSCASSTSSRSSSGSARAGARPSAGCVASRSTAAGDACSSGRATRERGGMR